MVTATTLARAQGAYYLLTGVWPILSPGTFQKVTGPKTDVWLVKTVGALVAVQGAALLARAQRVGPGLRGVAVGSALALAAVDVNYAAKGRIRAVYLLDAVAEVALAAAWARAGRGEGAPRGLGAKAG